MYQKYENDFVILELSTIAVYITKVVSSNPAHGEIYLLQHYLINFACDLGHDITEILLKVASLYTIILTLCI